MPTLLVDATTLTVNPKGVGKYACEVVIRLDRLLPPSWQIELIVFHGQMPDINGSSRLMPIEVNRQSDLKLGLYTVPRLIRKQQPDILLRLCDCAGISYPVPTITVCHDINELITGAQRAQLSLARRIINGVKEQFRISAIRASDVVVCNSEFTQRECISRYGLHKEKSRVGYCGVSDAYYEVNRDEAVAHIRSAFGCEGYVLSFATGDTRENYDILPEVMAITKQRNMTMPYVIAGIRVGDDYARLLREKLTALGLREREDFFFVPFLGGEERQTLCDLYAAANFYLELSLHEGFGMQLAEAMACGVHCLAPDHSALSEVGGDFVSHIDPTDADGIAEALVNAVGQQLHVQDHSAQVEHTRQFSWDQTANVIRERLMMLAGMQGE